MAGIIMHLCALAQSLSHDPSTLQHRYFKGEERIYLTELKKIVSDNPEALRYVRNAQTSSAVSLILGIGGIGVVGYAFFNILNGEVLNPYTFMVGSGLIILSISFGINSGINGGKAVKAYNNSIDTVSKIKTKSSVNLSFGGNGLSISYHF